MNIDDVWQVVLVGCVQRVYRCRRQLSHCTVSNSKDLQVTNMTCSHSSWSNLLFYQFLSYKFVIFLDFIIWNIGFLW